MTLGNTSIGLDIVSKNNSADISFFNGAEEAMTIRSGQIGIGTTSPASLTELYDTDADPIMTLTAAHNTDYHPQIQFRTDGTPTVKFSAGVDAFDDTFKISSGAGGVGGAGDIEINSSGTVSIPNLELGSLTFQEDTGVVSWADMSVTSASSVGTIESYTAYLDSNPLLTVYGESDGAGSVQNLGVGIGTTTPSAPLDVVASGTGTIASFTSDNATGCSLATDGTISCSSDERLKKNIDNLEIGIDTLMELRPVDYHWNTQEEEEVKKLGFIAQEVEDLLPELVREDANGYKQLNTTGMIPLLVKSIQDQQEEIQGIKSDIEMISTLESDIQTLNEEADALMEFFLALNPETLLYTDIEGNLDLTGGRLTAEEVVAGVFTVKTVDERSRTIGTFNGPKEKLQRASDPEYTSIYSECEEENCLFVSTTALSQNSKVFITSRDDKQDALYVLREEGSEEDGFKVSVKGEVSEGFTFDDVVFDWFVVEDEKVNSVSEL